MTEIAFNKSVDGDVLRDVVFLVYLSYDSRSERVDVSIATRMNGAAPPEVALTDIDLGSEHFWSLDDAARDGAFATLRRYRRYDVGPGEATPSSPISCRSLGPLVSRRPRASRKLS